VVSFLGFRGTQEGWSRSFQPIRLHQPGLSPRAGDSSDSPARTNTMSVHCSVCFFLAAKLAPAAALLMASEYHRRPIASIEASLIAEMDRQGEYLSYLRVKLQRTKLFELK
jgi:hypothetical protein